MDIKKLHQLLPAGSADEYLFVSTRDPGRKNRYKWDFVLEMGLSSDYGLFLPASLPCFTEAKPLTTATLARSGSSIIE